MANTLKQFGITVEDLGTINTILMGQSKNAAATSGEQGEADFAKYGALWAKWQNVVAAGNEPEKEPVKRGPRSKQPATQPPTDDTHKTSETPAKPDSKAAKVAR